MHNTCDSCGNRLVKGKYRKVTHEKWCLACMRWAGWL